MKKTIAYIMASLLLGVLYAGALFVIQQGNVDNEVSVISQNTEYNTTTPRIGNISDMLSGEGYWIFESNECRNSSSVQRVKQPIRQTKVSEEYGINNAARHADRISKHDIINETSKHISSLPCEIPADYYVFRLRKIII